MKRAMLLFNSLGLEPIPAPTDFRKYRVLSYLSIPTIEALKTSKMAMHEYFGILWSKLRG